MKFALIFLTLIVSVIAEDGFPSTPFTFVGVPEKIRDGSYDTGEGRYRSFQIRVIEVKKGSFHERKIDFPFPEESTPPLELGRRYLFTAVYDRHGIRFTGWKKLEEPNQAAQTTPGLRPSVSEL